MTLLFENLICVFDKLVWKKYVFLQYLRTDQTYTLLRINQLTLYLYVYMAKMTTKFMISQFFPLNNLPGQVFKSWITSIRSLKFVSTGGLRLAYTELVENRYMIQHCKVKRVHGECDLVQQQQQHFLVVDCVVNTSTNRQTQRSLSRQAEPITNHHT